MIVTVDVKPPHIAAGRQCGATETEPCPGCPVLLATREALQKVGLLPWRIEVTTSEVAICWTSDGPTTRAKLSRSVTEHIRDFDLYGMMFPFSFRLDVAIPGVGDAEARALDPLATGYPLAVT